MIDAFLFKNRNQKIFPGEKRVGSLIEVASLEIISKDLLVERE